MEEPVVKPNECTECWFDMRGLRARGDQGTGERWRSGVKLTFSWLGIVPVGFIPLLFEGKKPWLRELDWQVRWVDAHLHQLSDGQRCHTGPDEREKTPGVSTAF